MNRFALAMPALVVCVAALSAPVPALAAQDYKVFTTMECRPNGTAAANDLTYSYVGVLNTSTTENRVVICPLVKDSDSATFNTSFGDVTFSYRTATSLTGQVNCTVYVGYLGIPYYSASSSNPVVAADTYGESNLDMQTAGNYLAPVTMVCTLSPRTRLLRFITQETLITNTP